MPYNLRTPKSQNQVLPTPPSATVAGTDSDSFATDLPERPSPDGGEDHMPTSHDETEAWPDWDVPDNTVSYPVLAVVFIAQDRESLFQACLMQSKQGLSCLCVIS